MGVSVVICCYNSAERLPATLKYLLDQKINDSLDWEIILVNNNSKDSTYSIALEWAPKFENDFRIVDEPNPGLVHARKTGIANARYEYILFCDDDVWLSENYVMRAQLIMESHPEVGICGGRGIAVSENPLPYWFSNVQNAYAVGIQRIGTGSLNNRGYVWGAGMVMRRKVFETLVESGFESYCSGRSGSELSAGDDSELSKWFLLAGYTLWYDEDLIYQHFMPSNRLTISYYNKMEEGFDRANRILRTYDRVIQCRNRKTNAKEDRFETFVGLVDLFLRKVFRIAGQNRLKHRLQFLNPGEEKYVADEDFHRIYLASSNFHKRKGSISH